jgi:phosphatidylethanolamine-binding protein (PEBP) family uncharacterized protein
MKKIPLTKGRFALVDDDDFAELMKFKWMFSCFGYAVRSCRINKAGVTKKQTVWMHRVICNTPEGMLTDHINKDKLDNRRANLRVCTKSENGMNRGVQSNSKTGYKGVFFDGPRFKACITINGVQKHLGSYKTKEEAHLAYCKHAGVIHGEFSSI